MANPIFEKMQGKAQVNPTMQSNNPMAMIQQFKQFAQNFQGDPKQKVMELMQSGQLSSQQLNQLQATARQIQSMLFR